MNSPSINVKQLGLFFVCALFASHCLYSEFCGKIDAGPTFLHLDVLESGHTIKKINMPAIKADSTLMIWKGVCLKPTILYAKQGHNELISGGCGLGHYTPITDKCAVTPNIGCNITQFHTTIHYPFVPGVILTLKERFRSVSPYIGMDASYCFYKGWRVVGIYQYVWSRTHTKIKGLDSSNSSPEGSNYALMIEGDINDKWSVNIGGAYNTSLTKEKHGLRGYGARLAIAYWF